MPHTLGALDPDAPSLKRPKLLCFVPKKQPQNSAADCSPRRYEPAACNSRTGGRLKVQATA